MAHYCSRCGLRLVMFLSLPRNHYVHATHRVLQVPATADTRHSRQLQHRGAQGAQHVQDDEARYCPSPLGPPDTVNVVAMLHHTRRYQNLRSTTTLNVELDPANGLPSIVWDGTWKQKLHCIELLNDYSPEGAFHARFLWKDKHENSELLPKRPWTFPNASISVRAARNGNCVGAGQLVQRSWDTIIYLAREPGTPTAEQPHPSAAYEVYNCQVGQDRQVFNRRCPQLFVPATGGSTLLWTVRRVVTADEHEGRARPTRRLVLLDGYDRLVAANDGAWTNTQSTGAKRRHNVLRIYAPPHDGLVDAVVVSYVVLCAQLIRKVQWDSISSSD